MDLGTFIDCDGRVKTQLATNKLSFLNEYGRVYLCRVKKIYFENRTQNCSFETTSTKTCSQFFDNSCVLLLIQDLCDSDKNINCPILYHIGMVDSLIFDSCRLKQDFSTLNLFIIFNDVKCIPLTSTNQSKANLSKSSDRSSCNSNYCLNLPPKKYRDCSSLSLSVFDSFINYLKLDDIVKVNIVKSHVIWINSFSFFNPCNVNQQPKRLTRFDENLGIEIQKRSDQANLEFNKTNSSLDHVALVESPVELFQSNLSHLEEKYSGSIDEKTVIKFHFERDLNTSKNVFKDDTGTEKSQIVDILNHDNHNDQKENNSVRNKEKVKKSYTFSTKKTETTTAVFLKKSKENNRSCDSSQRKRGVKYYESIRKKSDRSKLCGFECSQCKKFYNSFFSPNTICTKSHFSSSQNDGNEMEKQCKTRVSTKSEISPPGKRKDNFFIRHFSSHKYKCKPASTPPKFWDVESF